MIVVNLFGGPGAAKSTLASGVFSLLKLHGINAELTTEFCKDLVWEKRDTAMQNQYYIWAKQYHKLFRLKDHVDIAITDSPLMLSCVYGSSNTSSHFFTLVNTVAREFNSLNFFIERKKKYNPVGRNQTEEEAIQLDNKIKSMLDFYNIEYVEVPGNGDGINKISEIILKRKLKVWIGSDLTQ